MTATAETYDLTIDGSAASTPKAPGAPSPRSTNSRLSTAIAERRHVPKRSGKADPTGHLTAEDVEALAMELDALRQEVLESRGASDAAYIRKMIDVQRKIELASRAVLLFSIFPPAWIVGTAGLSVAKILDNMEVGHNILHGQWDWMRDPKIHSTTWEWDSATPAALWKHSHNELHHTYTNVIGKDNDLGYGIMRVDEDQRWTPAYLGQPIYNFLNMCFFQYGIAAYDLEIGKQLAGRGDKEEFKRNGKMVLRKVGRQARKDYLVHPLISGPSFFHTIAANATANFVRNVWTHSVIMCGHFPSRCRDLRAGVHRGREPWRVVPAPDARLREHLGQQAHAHHDRQPEPPDRAPPVPRPAEQPLRRDRSQGEGDLRALRADLHRGAAAQAGRLRVVPGDLARAAQQGAGSQPRRHRRRGHRQAGASQAA